MAGFREFVTGEVLTAANVDDFLAKQAVMKFADASARDTALGTAVGGGNALREGMVAYLDDTNEVISFDGTSWATIGNAGIGINVVQTVKTDTMTSTVEESWTAITGLTASITPSSTSSKILLIASVNYTVQQAGGATNQLALSGLRFSGGNTSAYVGDAAGNRTRAAVQPAGHEYPDGESDWRNKISFNASMVYLDSPATTSATTYGVEFFTTDNTGSTATTYVNRSHADTDADDFFRVASSITAIEVAA